MDLPLHIRKSGHLFLFSIRLKGRSSRARGPLAQRYFPACSKKSMHRKVLSPVTKKARLLLLERAAQKSAGSRAQWWLVKGPGWSNDLGSSTQAIWKGYPRQSERVYLGLRLRSLNAELRWRENMKIEISISDAIRRGGMVPGDQCTRSSTASLACPLQIRRDSALSFIVITALTHDSWALPKYFEYSGRQIVLNASTSWKVRVSVCFIFAVVWGVHDGLVCRTGSLQSHILDHQHLFLPLQIPSTLEICLPVSSSLGLSRMLLVRSFVDACRICKKSGPVRGCRYCISTQVH
jgi:hypothetical protein